MPTRSRRASRALALAAPGLLAWLAAFGLAPAFSGWGGAAVFGVTLSGAVLLLAGLGVAVTGSASGILLSGRNTYSLSRLQMTLWTLLILSALIAATVCRAWALKGDYATVLAISMPPELLQVMGISLASAAAAPAVMALKSQPPTAGQIEAASARLGEPLIASGQAVTRPAGAQALLIDLVRGDELATAGTIDLSKVQQLAITGLIVVVYAGMLLNLFQKGGFNSAVTELPPFSQDLVTLLLVSHGGYLAWKAASKPEAPVPQRPPPPVPNDP